MNKDEILERSRKEHRDRDFVEDEALALASKIAISVGTLVCALLTIIQGAFQSPIDYGVWTVMFSIMSTIMLVKFAKLRKRHELLVGLAYLALAIFFFARYLMDLL